MDTYQWVIIQKPTYPLRLPYSEAAWSWLVMLLPLPRDVLGLTAQSTHATGRHLNRAQACEAENGRGPWFGKSQ